MMGSGQCTSMMYYWHDWTSETTSSIQEPRKIVDTRVTHVPGLICYSSSRSVHRSLRLQYGAFLLTMGCHWLLIRRLASGRRRFHTSCYPDIQERHEDEFGTERSGDGRAEDNVWAQHRESRQST